MIRLHPTDEQRAILDLGLDTMRISAGAGTGKTTTVAMVIANLVENFEIAPEQVLGITFTNKAAAELADRVRAYLGAQVDPGREVEVHTYHGFAGQILNEFGLLAGLERRPDVITPTFARQLLGESFYNSDFEHVDITWSGRINRIKQLGDRLGDHLLLPEDILGSVHPDAEPWPERVEMLKILEVYNDAKRRLSVVDYSDLITLSTRLVRENSAVAETIRGRYRAVVLDEYQDTNPAQRILLSSIFGDRFPVVAVGDADQTIYEWRGASPENFNLFGLHFSRPDGSEPHLMELTENYRSGQRILDVANQVRAKANDAASDLVSPNRDDGVIETHWAADAMAEAEWIARRMSRLHEDGLPWKEMAVLFRKNKDFPLIVETFARHEIPVEVANLGGLLSVPEVGELRAWMTLLARPDDTAAALQVLTGSRYRLGLADIAPVTRHLEQSIDPYRDEYLPMSLLEGLEEAAGIPGLSDEAIDRFQDFVRTYLTLLTETQGTSLVETARLILDQTRAWADVESLPEVPRLTARLNLYRFLDLTEDWSPLRGKTSLGAFLDYLDAMAEEPAEELDAARLSGEDAVSLVTIHRAKGLEWEVIAIPAVTKGNFPGRSQMFPDPHSKASVLPIQYRIDERYRDLPSDDKSRRSYLRAENEIQEWRVAYVGATRAKSHLIVTGAYWYGHPETNIEPKAPSELFELVRSHPISTDAGFATLSARPEILRHDGEVEAPDPVFEKGWRDFLATEIEHSGNARAIADELGVGDAHDAEVSHWEQRLFELSSIPSVNGDDDELTVSVTGLVTYAGCPKQYYWSEVDRLPRRRNPAAVAGTEIHRRIELHQKGAVPLDVIADQIHGTPGSVADRGPSDPRPDAFETFLGSRFGAREASLIESPFKMSIEPGFSVRGRIDAIYSDDQGVEIVDFKSGTPSADPARLVQLQAYAVAVDRVDFGLEHQEPMRVTFAYLGDGLAEESHRVDEDWLETARETISGIGRGIKTEEFQATPSERCHSCDFLQFCEPGRAYTSS